MLHQLSSFNINQLISYMNSFEHEYEPQLIDMPIRLKTAYHIMSFHLDLISILDKYPDIIDNIFINSPLKNLKNDIHFVINDSHKEYHKVIKQRFENNRRLFQGRSDNQKLIAQYFQGLPVFYKNKQPFSINKKNYHIYLKNAFGTALYNAFILNKEKKILKNTIKDYTLCHKSNNQQNRL